MMGRAGSLVKIRPCNKEYGGKTYLGLYLGNQPWSQTVSYNNKSGELTVGMATNPAIYVFDLQRIIFGAESWWGIIESLEELKDITDDDINNIWYVKALKAMHKDEPEETTEEKMKRISEAVKKHPKNFEAANKIQLGKYYAFAKPFDKISRRMMLVALITHRLRRIRYIYSGTEPVTARYHQISIVVS